MATVNSLNVLYDFMAFLGGYKCKQATEVYDDGSVLLDTEHENFTPIVLAVEEDEFGNKRLLIKLSLIIDPVTDRTLLIEILNTINQAYLYTKVLVERDDEDEEPIICLSFCLAAPIGDAPETSIYQAITHELRTWKSSIAYITYHELACFDEESIKAIFGFPLQPETRD